MGLMDCLGDISSAGYKASRDISRGSSVINDAVNISNGRLDKVAKKHLKKQAFKQTNKALNAGLRALGLK